MAGQQWQERLAEWFEGTECDAWVLRNETRNPSDFALFWLSGESGCDDFVQTYDQWMKYYEEQQIDAINSGLITLRKASGRANWLLRFRNAETNSRIEEYTNGTANNSPGISFVA